MDAAIDEIEGEDGASGERRADDANDAGKTRSAARTRRRARAPTFDLKALAARSDTQHSGRWALVLRRAIDAGQDRAIIEAVAQRFAVSDNVIRRLWREAPPALGQPPTWHLGQILRRLHEAGDRDWPRGIVGWNALIASAVPAEAV